MSDEVRDQLEGIAGRGRPRGAAAVLSRARRTPGRRASSWVAVAAAGLVVALGAGSLALIDDDDAAPEMALGSDAVQLVAFDDCAAYLDDVKAEAAEVVGPWGLPGGFGTTTLAPGGARESAIGSADGSPAASAAPPAADRSSAPSDTSTTNLQEVGVDEPDVVKTDGTTVFAVHGGNVRAVAARGVPKLLGSLKVDGSEALLVGNRLLVFGNGFGRPVPMPASDRRLAADVMPVAPSGSVVTVVDVSDPAAMRVVSRVELEGSYLAARSVEGVARIVVQSGPANLPFLYPGADTPVARERAAARNREVVRSSTIEDWTPSVKVTDGSGRTLRHDRNLACDQAFRPTENAGFGMLSLLTLDPEAPEEATSVSVRADGQLVYASTDRLYVATNAWGRIADGQVVEPSPRTELHAFDISGDDKARYVGSGAVRGTALNQFSLSSHKGHLRVATTDHSKGGESFVTVLAERADQLTVVGTIGGLGRGEQIHAVRFIGDLGYVVTFRQTDPLYVIDLAEPTNPRLRGELKIPGFSAYLHPVGDDLLLGIGQDATDEGRRLGSQASLFDISDPGEPRQLDRLPLGTASSSSPVEFDHRAFLWWAPLRLAMLPISQHDERGGDSGAVVVRVAATEITEVGRVRHPSPQGTQIERSLVIGDRLFTYSFAGLLASNLSTLTEVAWVPFPEAG